MAISQAISEFVPLLKTARPSVYKNNAFRITGLDVDASPPEIARQIQKLEMVHRLGLGEAEGVVGPFSSKQQHNLEAIEEARRRLNDPELRIVDEFFWFWPTRHGEHQSELWGPNRSSDDPALQALRRDDIALAIRIWTDCQRNGSDGTATHNLAVLYHLQALEIELGPVLVDSTVERGTELYPGQNVTTPDGKGSVVAVRRGQVLVRLVTGEANFYDREKVVIGTPAQNTTRREASALWSGATANWERLKSEHAFWQKLENRIRLLDDPRMRPSAANHIRLSFPIALASIDVALVVGAAELGNFAAATTHLTRLRACGLPANRMQDLLDKSTLPVRSKVGELCRRAESELSATPERTPAILKKLLEDANPLREILNYVLGAGNPARDSMQDQLANLIKESLPQYANSTKNFASCRALLKEACQLAASPYVRSLCQGDLDTVNSLVADQISDLIIGVCKDAEQAVTGNPQDGERIIRKLLADTDVLFEQLQEATDPRSDVRILAYDYVARTGRNCVVDFGNACKRWTVCQELLQQCRTVAASAELIKRIEGDIGVARSNSSPQSSGVNFTIPRPHPTQSHVPTRSSPQLFDSGIWKVIAVIIGIIVFFILLKSCDTSSGGSSDTHMSPPVSNGTTSVSAGTATDAAGVQDRIAVLKAEIESGRSQLRQLESSQRHCDQILSNYEQLITNDRQQLDRMKSSNEAGVYVDESEYERIRERHNSNVNLYNASIASCRENNNRYENALNTTNREVEEYNHLISSR